jgi:hypothetical protein
MRGDFRNLRQKKLLRGEVGFLQGFLRFSWCFSLVNRGDIVVNCVAGVVFWQSLFRG